MKLVAAVLFSLISLHSIFSFADDGDQVSRPDNHQLFKCNFIDEKAEPKFLSVIADPEWSQVVWMDRQGNVVPPAKDVQIRLEQVHTTPVSYIWKFLNKQGQPYVQIQELVTDPPRVSILGRKPGSFDCYRQFSEKIDYYKRF